jgi:hypothetical protein
MCNKTVLGGAPVSDIFPRRFAAILDSHPMGNTIFLRPYGRPYPVSSARFQAIRDLFPISALNLLLLIARAIAIRICSGWMNGRGYFH